MKQRRFTNKKLIALMLPLAVGVEEQYSRQSNIIDYRYANYDIAAVEADYDKTVDELSRAQLALDAINGRETFDLGE